MTTIAIYKNTIACDLQLSHSSGLKFRGPTKIIDVPVGTAQNVFGTPKAFIGYAGSADEWATIVDFYLHMENYKKPPKIKSVEMLLLNNNKHIFHGTNLTNWLRIKEPFFAIGSGSHIAIGAMAQGATAKEAVQLASKHDPNTGLGVKEYEL